MSSSPTCHSPDFKNCTTATFQPRATARITTPNAELDLPLPSPVFTTTTDGRDPKPLGQLMLGRRLLLGHAVNVHCDACASACSPRPCSCWPHAQIPSYEPSSARADLEAAGLTAVQAECVTQGLDGSFSERRLDSRETPSTREQERFAEILDECGVDAE